MTSQERYEILDNIWKELLDNVVSLGRIDHLPNEKLVEYILQIVSVQKEQELLLDKYADAFQAFINTVQRS